MSHQNNYWNLHRLGGIGISLEKIFNSMGPNIPTEGELKVLILPVKSLMNKVRKMKYLSRK